jgi:uncharacterized protein YjbI with pentapeptide repeats
VFGWLRSILDRLKPKVPSSPVEAEVKVPREAAQGDLATATILLEGESPSRDLRGKSFAGVDLSGRDFSGANLEKAIFTRANLDDANLSRAKLDGAIFRNASLRRANLSDASGLRSDQFPGADLTGAKLPEIVGKFETLAVIKDASDQAKTLFIALIAACAFSWLTIGATRDVSLLSNSSTTPLPIINVPLPIDGFYMVAPVLLLMAYFYFHLSLQRLWEQLADLPAFFPDGNAADKRVYPWFLSGLMWSKADRSRRALGKGQTADRSRRALGKAQTAASVLLAYALVPLTLIGFWGRYLTAHDWIGTGFHAGLIVLAAALAAGFWQRLGATFAGEDDHLVIWSWIFIGALLPPGPVLWNALQGAQKSDLDIEPARLAMPTAAQIAAWVFIVIVLAIGFEFLKHRKFWHALKHGSAAAAPVAALVLVSVGAIEAVEPNLPSGSFRTEGISDWDPRRWIPRLTAFFHHGPIATFTEADVSTKPANWGEKENLDSVKGANLQRGNLRYVHAERAFLAGADLRGANLRYARFDGADLRNTDFRGADLTGAMFAGAKLEGAILLKADVFRADFVGATGLIAAQAATAKNSQLAWWPQTVLDEKFHGSFQVEGAVRAKGLPTNDLRGCELGGHDVRGFTDYQVAGADFRDATVSLANSLPRDFVLARWDANVAKSLSLPRNHNDRLTWRDFCTGEYSSILKRNAQILDLSGFHLDTLDLKGVNFGGTRLVGATFFGASLEGAFLEGADVAFADFTGASGLNPNQIKSANNWQLSKYDANLLAQLGLPTNHNTNVSERKFIGYRDLKLKLTGAYDGKALFLNADLTGIDLRGFRGDLSLMNSTLDNANVAGVRLRVSPSVIKKATNWRLARFSQLSMPMILDKRGNGSLVYGADLSDADVSGANLRGMDLREGMFKGAYFISTDLRGATFEGSDFTGARFYLADIRWTDFRGAKKLTPEQIRTARFWRSAYYDDDLRKKLGLPDNQNQIVHRLETFLKDAP